MSLPRNSGFLFCVVILCFLLMPTGLIPGGAKYGMIIFSGLFIFAISFLSVPRFGIHSVAFLTLSVFIFISLVVSKSSAPDDFVEIFRPIYYYAVFTFCRNFSSELSEERLAKLLVFFVLFQFVVVLAQRLGVSPLVQVVEMFWDTEKNWFARNTGTFSNPNILGIFTVMAWIGYALLSNSGALKKLAVLSIVMTVVFFSGSRTSLALLLVAVSMVYFLKYSIAAFSIWAVICIPVLLFSGYFIMESYSESNPYMAQMINFFETGDLSSVKAYADRMDKWQDIFSVYGNPSILNFLFGYGPSKEGGLRFVDNEYFSVWLKYGLLGAALYYLLIVMLLMKLRRFQKECPEVAKLYNVSLVVVTVLAVAGVTLETFSSWQVPFIMYFYLGVAWGKVDEAKRKAVSGYRGAGASV